MAIFVYNFYMEYKLKQFKNIKYTIKDNNSETTLVMVHGYKSSSDTYLPLYKLNNNFNMISINYLGNKYYEGDKIYNIKEVARSIDDIISEIQTDVILVGHSFGGAVISEVKNDSKIKGYVFMSSFTKSFLDSKLHSSLIRLANKDIPDKIIDTMIAVSAKKFNFDPIYAKGFLDSSGGFEIMFNENILNKEYIRTTLDENIKKITKPILAIIGEKDLVIPVESYKKYFKEMGVDTNIVPKSEHNPMKTKPSVVNDILNKEYTFKERIHKNIIKQQN